MQSSAVFFAILVFIGTTFAQIPPGFFSGAFTGGIPSAFPGFQGSRQQQVPTPGNGRASTGMRLEGPILFPPSPESRDTSGVIVGASGYGFIPPGVNAIVQQQGRGSPSSFPSFSQPFSSNFFNI